MKIYFVVLMMLIAVVICSLILHCIKMSLVILIHSCFVMHIYFYFAAFGPVYETDDPNQFMQHMEDLMALGGGDEPEMCLSAVQVTLDALCFCTVQYKICSFHLRLCFPAGSHAQPTAVRDLCVH